MAYWSELHFSHLSCTLLLFLFRCMLVWYTLLLCQSFLLFTPNCIWGQETYRWTHLHGWSILVWAWDMPCGWITRQERRKENE